MVSQPSCDRFVLWLVNYVFVHLIVLRQVIIETLPNVNIPDLNYVKILSDSVIDSFDNATVRYTIYFVTHPFTTFQFFCIKMFFPSLFTVDDCENMKR